MDEFERLIHGDDAEGELLRSALDDRPTDAARAKAAAAFDAFLDGPLAPGPENPPPSPETQPPPPTLVPKVAPPASAFPWLLTGLGALGVVAIAGFALRKPAEAPVRVAEAPTAVAAPSPPPPPVPAPVASAAPIPVPEPVAPVPSVVEPPRSLADEVAAIDRVRQKMHSGDPKGAIRELDSYKRNFPRGELQETSIVLRIEIYAKNGRTDDAKALATRFTKRYPNSPFLGKVRELVP